MKKLQGNKERILVLDGDHKNALAIVRHLGKTNQYIIDAVSFIKASVAFYSKYINREFIVSHPKKDPDKYINDILDILRKNRYTVIIPVSHISYQLCSVHKDKIQKYTHITIAKSKHIYLASNKIMTYQLAHKLGIPYPSITIINDIKEIENVNTEFPCIIKGPFEAGKNIVEYAHNKKDLIEKYKKICRENDFKNHLPFIQKFIKGEGAGFFAFYKNGKCKNYFIHKRIREYPVKGGASTVAESFYNEDVKKYGKQILDYLKWEGVAMVEFKKDNNTGLYNLMEINAKFWGSLDLALVCGVNFPQMLIDNALGREVMTLNKYDNYRFQWILNGDLFHVLERPWKLSAFVKDLFCAKNDLYLTDIKPNLFQLLYIPVHYYKKWLK